MSAPPGERACENCGRPFVPKDPRQPMELTCSPRCRANSRRRRRARGLTGAPTVRRLHVEPVPVPGWRWLARVWPAYRRRMEREARLVWVAIEDIGQPGTVERDRVTIHYPPEPCQACGALVVRSTRSTTRTKRGLVFCSPEHRAAVCFVPAPLRPVCPRPEKRVYATAEEARAANGRLFHQHDLMDVYLCACTWYHVGKRKDRANTIRARARITRLAR